MIATRSRLFGMLIGLVAGGCGSTGNQDCTDPAKCPCSTDSQCSAPNPRCDPRTTKCVPCLPTADNCSNAQHCVYLDTGFTCVAKDVCALAEDCPLVGGRSQLCCDGKCSDRYNDGNNCGACGTVCDAAANADTGCVNGSCAVTVCKAGFGNCDAKAANGCEADVTGDINNCGACGTPCKKAANTTVACAAGKCANDCVANFADCDGNAMNGCETSTDTNPKNCGACGKTCPSLPNSATVACSAGTCVVETCLANFADCNKNPGDGCESNTTMDANNCAGCGKKCPAVQNGAAGCNASSCGVGKCNNGFADCDGNVLNGCELDLSSDPKNCGACGLSCMGANSVQSCQGGVCLIQSCNQGFSDCDNNPANGCESITSRDLKNCGACGVVCPVPANATAQCSNGVCGLGSCMYGWGDCNKNVNDGCETDLLQVNNCGACGVACGVPVNGVAACKMAMCTVGSCSLGYSDCDNKFVNGCEVSVVADPMNCGGCGSVCMPAKGQESTCVMSKCQLGACQKDLADCNNDLMRDGCETDLTTDAQNCGQCGMKCPMNAPYCMKSMCSAVSYATVTMTGGNRDVVFVYAPAGTTFNTDMDYATWCSNSGFTQNQNATNNAVYVNANMFNAISYYCNSYCCYLGAGNSKAQQFMVNTFKNFGLPLNKPLQVLDRGCGWYGGSFSLGMNTTDTLTVTGPGTYMYGPNALGAQDYQKAKVVTFKQDGVIVCQAN